MRGHVYPLSNSVTEAMENYVQESLQQGFSPPLYVTSLL
jgi:hypothetical protein